MARPMMILICELSVRLCIVWGQAEHAPSCLSTFMSVKQLSAKYHNSGIYNVPHILNKDDVVRPSLDAVTIISHTLRTRLAPRRNPCADTARLSASNSQTRYCANLSGALVERISRWPTLQSPSVGKEAQLTCLVLQLIQTLSSLRHLCDVFSHNSDCVVNLLLDGRSLGVASRRAAAGGSAASARDIWIVRFRPGYP